jgi:HTH-type transcriptional regulator/antitoxin HigA
MKNKTPLIRLIESAQDYEVALSEIYLLIQRDDLNQAEAQFLKVQSKLVDDWEKEQGYGLKQPSVKDWILHRMEERGLSRRDLIPYIGSASRVNEILNDKRGLTIPMIRALHKHLNIPLEALTQEPLPHEDSQHDYLLSQAPRYKNVIKKLNFNFSDFDEVSVGLNTVITKLGGFEQIPKGALARKNDENRVLAKTDRIALQLWMIRLLDIVNDKIKNVSPYKGIDTLFLQQVAKLSIFPDGLTQAFELLQKRGIFVEVLPHPQRTYLDGATLYFKGHPIIGLTLRYDRLDNVWFTLMHELAHVVNDLDALKQGDIFTDDITIDTKKGGHSDIEKKADETAKEAFIPSEYETELQDLIDTPILNKLLNLAGKLQINPAILAGRVRYSLGNYRIFKEFSSFKTGLRPNT